MAKVFKKESISVAFMVEQLRTAVGVSLDTIHEGDASERLVTESDLHRPGLILAGFTDLFTHQRVQIIGNTENSYLRHLPADERAAAVERLMSADIPCVFLTEKNELNEDSLEVVRKHNVPVYRSSIPSTEFAYYLRDFLEDQFALQMNIHGSLVDVYGVGMLLTGKAGIGKSEVALDLVERGHRLVADDVVIVTKEGQNVLMGAGTDVAQHCMEIRGLGIVDVRAMFGIRAIRFQKRVELIVKMQVWDPEEEYTRVRMVEEYDDVMGVKLPVVKLPIIPGKNVTVICEVIAMNHLLQHYGHDAAEQFAERLQKRIEANRTGAKPADRGVQYFEHDYE